MPARRGNRQGWARSWRRPAAPDGARSGPRQLVGDDTNHIGIRRRADIEDSGPADTDEREAELRGDRWGRERLCDRNAIGVRGVLLRPAAHHADVRELSRNTLEKGGLAAVRLEQGHLAVRQRGSERQAGRPSPDPTSTIGPS